METPGVGVGLNVDRCIATKIVYKYRSTFALPLGLLSVEVY